MDIKNFYNHIELSDWDLRGWDHWGAPYFYEPPPLNSKYYQWYSQGERPQAQGGPGG